MELRLNSTLSWRVEYSEMLLSMSPRTTLYSCSAIFLGAPSFFILEFEIFQVVKEYNSCS